MRALAVPLVTVILAGCSHLAVPRAGERAHFGQQGFQEPVLVPYLPPPGKVEIVGKPPPALKDPVWVEGQWEWTGARWQWKDGGWEDQPKDQYYAEPIFVRMDDGKIVYVPGRWTTFPLQ
jgi:hypothetical protein